MAETRYQFRDAGDWTTGQPDFAPIKANTFDRLRFHRGKGFVMIEGATMTNPQSDLGALLDRVGRHLAAAPVDTVVDVRAIQDQYIIRFRRHIVLPDKGQLVLSHAADLRGATYVLGGLDCSGLTMHCYGLEGVTLPHNAHEQRLDPQVKTITRAQLKPGDLLFIHNDEHVAMFLDGMRVWDTEPADAPAPWGGNQGTGVQIRSMEPGYYCAWSNVNAIGRVEAINGRP